MAATKNRTRKSVEQREAEAEALQASIADQVEALRSSDRWKNFLSFAATFHRYSFNNLMLILAQKPDATAVAGYRQWQQRGRQVQKDPTSIRIFRYASKKITEEDETGREVTRTIRWFPVVSVFDISDTKPIEGHDDPTAVVSALHGTDDFGVVAALSAHLSAQGWSIVREELHGGRNGYTDPKTRRVVLGTHLSPEHSAKTMIHEAAHIVLGHIDDLAAYAQHRGVMETEAESVAYVVAGMLGFDTAAYSIGYIAGWSKGDVETIKDTAARVLRAAHELCAVFEEAEETHSTEQAA